MNYSPQGLIIYEGPSNFDGKDIVSIITGFDKRSDNRKTGPMLQCFILCKDLKPTEAWKDLSHQSVFNDCKHGKQFGNSCYVNLGMGVNGVWQAYKRGSYGLYTKWEERSYCSKLDILGLFDGESVRFGAFGDPCAVPFDVWKTFLQGLQESNGQWTGYTHSWKVCDPRFKEFVVASVDNPDELAEARKAGWRTFRTMTEDEVLEPGEFLCPATEESWAKNRRQVRCIDCCACDGLNGRSQRRGSAAIRVHGLGWKVQNYLRIRGKKPENLTYAVLDSESRASAVDAM
mgnify:CR=1 FL=1